MKGTQLKEKKHEQSSISEEPTLVATKQSRKVIRNNGLPLHSRGLAMTKIPLPKRHCEEVVRLTKQSKKVIRNVLLRRFTHFSLIDASLLLLNANRANYI